MEVFVPGIITASGCPKSCLGCKYFTVTDGSDSRGSKSVKLAILGKRITAMFSSELAFVGLRSSKSRESSAGKTCSK